jgi:hypothetical protein
LYEHASECYLIVMTRSVRAAYVALSLATVSAGCVPPSPVRPPDVPSSAARTLRRFAAPEASQAVAVDDRFFYAIGSAVIGKYDKRSGARVGEWKPAAGQPIAHLNSGIVVDGLLYCAHSNYPDTPMVSSIQIFDAARLSFVRSIPLPGDIGSATWIDRGDGVWWVAFAHYAGKGGIPGKGPEATRLVRFDGDWKVEASFAFPPAVVTRWGAMSSSGGVRTGPRTFVTTGHDAPEVYVVDVPERGDELILGAIVPIESEGQGIAVDSANGTVYGIRRRTREVIVSEIPSLYSLIPHR